MSEVRELETLLRDLLPEPWIRAVETGDDDALASFVADDVHGRSLANAVAAEGWLTPEWPTEYGGRGIDADAAVLARRTLARWRVGRVESAIGSGWIGPTILQYGTPEQRDLHLPRISHNEVFWCQLFSETEAGSDLASVRTAATATDGGWVLNGGKVWTSRADISAWGLAVVRTDTSVVKHAGLSVFLVPMDAPGVTIAPIKQMTGDAEFFEVRLDNVSLPNDSLLGTPGQGWEIVRTVLAFERRAGSGAGAATPGSVIGRGIESLIEERWNQAGAVERTRLASSLVDDLLIGLNNARNAALRAAGAEPIAKGAPVNKVLQAEHTKRLQGLRMSSGSIDRTSPAIDDMTAAADQWAFMRVQAKTIAGGTSEVLRDQIAERALGLPRFDDPSKRVPWRDFIAQLAKGQS
ncbi:acyl-CoA dehydrogenase family protein [Microbacterium sp. NC79]|uniref:acyl-CoA dehydrogenase family protein n=1 Tax=Microbacterium sp. NC79 TaxID=2851009 RepID=UPI001C2BD7A0|nr:acyl-CoA dehydrogenase family protein [Microbacterium sp. NC79]MBV0896132.1 acyl-CoA dehydrogenase family protein [Microbacterium sp. NC79]